MSQSLLLPLFRDADWLSRCANFVSACHIIAYFESYVYGDGQAD